MHTCQGGTGLGSSWLTTGGDCGPPLICLIMTHLSHEVPVLFPRPDPADRRSELALVLDSGPTSTVVSWGLWSVLFLLGASIVPPVLCSSKIFA